MTNGLFAARMKQHKRTTRLTSRTTCRWAMLGLMALLDCVPSRPVEALRAEPTQATPPLTPTVRLVREFVVAWRQAHREAAVPSSPLFTRLRTPPGGTPIEWLVSLRMLRYNGIEWEEGGWYNSHFADGLRERMYAHRVTRRSQAAYCPDWSAVPLSPPERPVWAQEKLFPSVARAAVVQGRAVLLTALEATSQEAPTDSVAVGPRVRFALDAGDGAGMGQRER